MFSLHVKKIKTVLDLLKIYDLLKPRLPSLALAALFMAVMALATASYAYLVGPVLKSLFVQSPESVNTLSGVGGKAIDNAFLTEIAAKLSGISAIYIGLLVIVASVVKGIAFYLQRILVIRAGQQVLHALRMQLFDGVLQMNPLQRDDGATGSLISRFTVDSHVVEQAVTGGMMALVSSFLQMVALAGLAISLSWELGLIGLVAFPPIAVLISRLGRLLRKRQGKFYDAYHNVSQVVDESVNGLGVLQSFGAERFAQKRFDKESASLVKRAISAFSVSAFSSPLNEVLGATALGVTLWYAQMQIQSEQLTPEAFISFFTALFLLYRPVKGFGTAVHALQTGFAAFDKLEPLLRPTRRFYGNRKSSPGVLLKGICVGYADNELVLNGLSVAIRPGEKVAVVGESGGGKTTLLNVLCGYLEPRAGVMECDWPVAFVPQTPFLFDDTISANVSLGNPDVSQSQIEEACFQAGVTAFAREYSEGFMYKVGANGKNLSAGERQRVCLARALASQRNLLLLDEVTASLDGKNENLIIDTLTGLSGKTVIAVTHRAQTAAWADRTLVLDEGRVVDDGKLSDLLDRSSVVKRLFAFTTDRDEHAKE